MCLIEKKAKLNNAFSYITSEISFRLNFTVHPIRELEKQVLSVRRF